MATDGKKTTVTGSCHCGNIKYTAAIKIAPDGTFEASRCNCTFCQKLSTTNLRLEESDFKLLSPASKSELKDYCPRTPTGHKYFCHKCGVHVWGEGSYEFEGQKFDFFAINAATIDQPQEGIDLSKVKFSYWDGLNDNWYAGLSEKPWAGGLP